MAFTVAQYKTAALVVIAKTVTFIHYNTNDICFKCMNCAVTEL